MVNKCSLLPPFRVIDLTREEVEKIVPTFCEGLCDNCVKYKKDTNVCEAVALFIDFPAFESLNNELLDSIDEYLETGSPKVLYV